MARPVISAAGEELYEALEPLAYDDERLGWPLLLYCEAVAGRLQKVNDLVRDEGARPGWAVVMSPDTAPVEALPWLAQFVGVRITGGLDEATQRQRIRETDGWKRGTPAALAGAARQHLTGTQTAVIRERDGSPYQLTVITYTSETPDPDLVLAALLEQKPAGIVMTYSVLTHIDYTELAATYTTYDDLAAAFATYNAIA